jgi:hypothetical protein
MVVKKSMFSVYWEIHQLCLSPYWFSATPVALNEPFWEINFFRTKSQSQTPRPVYHWKAETMLSANIMTFVRFIRSFLN